jgi:hypothetical protein
MHVSIFKEVIKADLDCGNDFWDRVREQKVT